MARELRESVLLACLDDMSELMKTMLDIKQILPKVAFRQVSIKFFIYLFIYFLPISYTRIIFLIPGHTLK